MPVGADTAVLIRSHEFRENMTPDLEGSARATGGNQPTPDRLPTVGQPESRERIIRFVAVIAALYATYWIYWRWFNTINVTPQGIVPSLLLMVTETWAYLNMLFFVFLCWKLENREPGEPLEGRSVDVFITVFDEPLEVVRRTAMGARAIRYPHRTYLLDDGKRDDVLQMTKQLGIGYIRRVGDANAKAGNLNFALSVTSGEFVLQLDADHVPLPSIIDRLLGYFRDPKVVLAQGPQDFYNVDSFTHIVNDEGRRLWEENRIFFSLIQPGRDHWNASFFCGSCGILRRSALEEIGGFLTQTVIEDMETTIELHARGWKTVYHSETLAYGLAPGAAGAYHVQRLRWGQGAMQILRKVKPLTKAGLTFPQRLAYFAGTAVYFEGMQKAVFYLTPLFFFFTGILPIDANEEAFLIRLVPYLGLSILSFELLSRGTGYLFITERYTMMRVWTYLKAIPAIFFKRTLEFRVTPKGQISVPASAYVPQAVLMGLSIAAPIWASIAYYNGWISYDSRGWGSLAFWLNSLWALWNFYFAFFVVRHTLIMRQQRHDHRFLEQLPISVRVVGDEGGETAYPGLTLDLNPTGMGFRSTFKLQVGTRVRVDLPLVSERVTTAGEIRHVSEEQTRFGPVFLHGVAFEDVPIETRDAIEVHVTQHAMPKWRMRYRQSVDIMTRTSELMHNLRGDRRRLVGLPANVFSRDGAGTTTEIAGMMILEELSPRGAKLLGEVPIDPGTRIFFDVPGASVAGDGVVRHVTTLETALAVLFVIGVELTVVPVPERLRVA